MVAHVLPRPFPISFPARMTLRWLWWPGGPEREAPPQAEPEPLPEMPRWDCEPYLRSRLTTMRYDGKP